MIAVDQRYSVQRLEKPALYFKHIIHEGTQPLNYGGIVSDEPPHLSTFTICVDSGGLVEAFDSAKSKPVLLAISPHLYLFDRPCFPQCPN